MGCITDFEQQDELEKKYNSKLRQKMAEEALYLKNGTALNILFFGQLHSDIVTAAKISTVPLFETVHKDYDIV